MKRWYAFTQLLLARMREFYRQPAALFWVYGFPLLLAVGLGIAFARGEPEAPPIDLVADQGNPPPGLVEFLTQAGLAVQSHPLTACKQRLRTGKSSLYLQVEGSEYHCVFDRTRADSLSAFHQVDATLMRWQQSATNGSPPRAVLHVDPVIVTDPGSRYIDFLIPGLMGLNLLSGGLFGVGYALVDMRVRKLLKRLLATPMHRGDFLAAIVVARVLLLLPEMGALLAVAHYGFKVPIVGSLVTVAFILLVAALTFDGMGLLLACRTEKPETIGGLINLIMLPMWLLSGTFFSSKRYPDAMQPLIQALPLTQVNDALREVLLEGQTLTQVAWRLGILAVWGGASYLLALKLFRWH